MISYLIWIAVLLVVGLIVGIVPRDFWGILSWIIILAIAIPIGNALIGFVGDHHLVSEALKEILIILGVFLSGAVILILFLFVFLKITKGALGLKDYGAGLPPKSK